MNFDKELKNYMTTLNCSAKELSDASGISPAQISRYINGKRTPRIDSVQLDSIITGLSKIAESRNADISKKEISVALKNSIPEKNKNSDEFVSRLNLVITKLKLNVSDLAYSLNYDSSFISRVRNGTRTPSNIDEFAGNFADYTAKHFNDQKSIETVSALIGQSTAELTTPESYSKQLAMWLTSKEANTKPIEEFLSVVNSSVVTALTIPTEKTKFHTSPIIPSISRHYFGIEGMKKAEVDFFKMTILSSSKDNVFIYSDLSMSEVDERQFDKLVFAANALIDKGISLDLIHNIDRPISEMLLGLQGWMPIYIKGNVNPYYFVTKPDNTSSQILATSGAAAMYGESIGNDKNSVHIKTTTNKKQVEWFRKKSDYFLSNARPLMKVYREGDEAEFTRFIEEEKATSTIRTYTDKAFENIDFYIKDDKWISVNKIAEPKVHFVIYNDRLINSIKELLNRNHK